MCSLFYSIWDEIGTPFLNKIVRKRGRRGSPRAHTLSARSYGLYGPFGSLFGPISVNFQPMFAEQIDFQVWDRFFIMGFNLG